MSTFLPGISQLNVALATSLREESFESLVLVDIDLFHSINKDFGTKVGDRVISIVEGLVRDLCGNGYRIGGDQYALQNTDMAKVEELRHAIKIVSERQVQVPLTLSGGGVCIDRDLLVVSDESVHALYGAAANLLTLAKQQGRDRVLWITSSKSSAETSEVAEQLYRELARIGACRARKMEVESKVDALTGLYNRRGFEDIFNRMVEASQRAARPLALIYLDSDSLKSINDRHGHEAGDRFIIDLASILRSVARQSDFVFRWGADEFAIVLESGSESRALILAQRLRKAVAERTEGTVSVGIYCGIPTNVSEAIQAADEAMYLAKKQGKDRVVVGDSDRRC